MYTTARLLASINVEALARFEGFDVPGEPQTTVSEQEGLLMQASQLSESKWVTKWGPSIAQLCGCET